MEVEYMCNENEMRMKKLLSMRTRLPLRLALMGSSENSAGCLEKLLLENLRTCCQRLSES